MIHRYGLLLSFSAFEYLAGLMKILKDHFLLILLVFVLSLFVAEGQVVLNSLAANLLGFSSTTLHFHRNLLPNNTVFTLRVEESNGGVNTLVWSQGVTWGGACQ